MKYFVYAMAMFDNAPNSGFFQAHTNKKHVEGCKTIPFTSNNYLWSWGRMSMGNIDDDLILLPVKTKWFVLWTIRCVMEAILLRHKSCYSWHLPCVGLTTYYPWTLFWLISATVRGSRYFSYERFWDTLFPPRVFDAAGSAVPGAAHVDGGLPNHCHHCHGLQRRIRMLSRLVNGYEPRHLIEAEQVTSKIFYKRSWGDFVSSQRKCVWFGSRACFVISFLPQN